MRLKYFLSSLITGLLFVHLTVFADDLKATVDRTDLSINETVMLTLTLNGSSDDNAPDWHVLDKDFNILGNSTNQQLAIINGKMSQITAWIVVLAPKHEGTITIPSLTVGKLKSEPLTIQVNSVKQSLAKGQAPAIFLQTKIEPKTAYVQQQLTYTVSLYHNAAILSGGFAAPELPNAIIKPLSNDTEYQAKLNGRTYQVIERHYVIFPQTSGKMTLKPSMFGGTIAEPIRRNDLLDDSTFIGSSAKPVQINATPIELEIKQKPANFSGQQWLPAKEITLKQSWSAQPPVFHVGEPITLTLTMKAKGLTADQLPTLTLPTINNLNTYPDRPILTTNADGTEIVGVREQKIALIPTKEGNLELPAMTINWWNTETDKAEAINIPAQTFKVLPATNAQPSSPPIPNTPVATTAIQPLATAPTTPMAQPVTKATFNYWPWLIALISFVAWIITLFFLLQQRRNKPVAINFETKPDSLSNVRKQLHQACDANNPEQAKAALLTWANLRWPNVIMRSLIDIAEHIQAPELKSAIRELDRLLYSGEATSWDGKKFWQAFQDARPETPQNKTSKDDSLPPLYL